MGIKDPGIPRPPQTVGNIELDRYMRSDSQAFRAMMDDLRMQINWPIASVAPTEVPHRIPMIKLGTDGRLYIYYNGSWKTYWAEGYKPAFIVTPSANTVLTLIDTYYVIAFNSEIMDLQNNFNSTNYTFYAPIDGAYSFHAHLRLMDYDFASTAYHVRLSTSNNTFITVHASQQWATADASDVTLDMSYIAWMDAGDVAYVEVKQVGGSANPAYIHGSGGYYTYFSGALIG